MKPETEKKLLKSIDKIAATLDSIDGCLFLIYRELRENRKTPQKKGQSRRSRP